MKITKLKTFEDACEVLSLNATEVIPSFAGYPLRDRKAIIAHAKLVIIVRAANRIANGGKDWEPNWDNGKWDKYHVWFWMNGGSSGFQCHVCDHWSSDSGVGSRLCFISREVSEHVGNQFIELYKDYFVL
jgi:hypothetical protein